MSQVLEQIKATGKARIKDEGRVQSLLKTLLDGGYGNLQVIADFDRTLTRTHRNGQDLHCSWGVFETSKFVPQRYLMETQALRSKYLPIELDAHMSIEEKTPHIVEWYNEANRMLADVGTVNRAHFADMVKDSNVELREGTQDLMTHLKGRGVPVLVLSAGLGDMVREILVGLDAMHPNMHLVSNFLKYDAEGNIVGMSGDHVIHVYNKNEKSLKNLASEEFNRQIRERKNVILMGDSLGDVGMADGVENPEAVLKIGFLNHGEESEADKIRLDKYLDAYDIVLVDDQTMKVAQLITQQLDDFEAVAAAAAP